MQTQITVAHCTWDAALRPLCGMPDDIPEGSLLTGIDEAGETFRLILENVLEYGICILDPDGKITTWATGSQQLHGFNPQDVLNRHLSLLYSAGDSNGNLAETALATARENGESITEGWRTRKDGSRFWANVVITALREAAGTLRGFCEITRDDTARKQAGMELEAARELAQEAARSSEMTYRSVIDALCSEIAVIDGDGTILAVNNAWNDFAAESGVANLVRVGVGQNYLAACEAAARAGDPFGERTLAGLKAVLDGTLNEFTLEYPCHAPDKQRWFLLSASPWRFGRGAAVSHTEITRRVLAEKTLRQSEAHYRALIENEVDVVTILKPDGTIMFESPALERILGYTPEELVGRNVFEFIHPGDIEMIRGEIERVIHTSETSRPVEFAFRHKDGAWRTMESVARNLLAHPAVGGIIVNSRDITQRRAAEAELRSKEIALKSSHEQLQALAGRLLETEERERRRISRELHDDLNQKLAALAVDLGGIVTVLRNSPVDEIERQLRENQKGLARVSEEVRSLAYQLHPSILDDLGLAVALRSYCNTFARREHIDVRFTHRGLKRKIAPSVATCIYRIVQEALRNIAKHAKAKRVSVSVVQTSKEIVTVIRDDGIGFRPEMVRPGRSLGLKSMAERARLIGGAFAVESSPGTGTTLTLTIPVGEAYPP